MKLLWTSAIASTVFFAGTMSGNAIVFTLYNANGTNLPHTQGILKPSAIEITGAPTSSDETVVAGGVRLNTTSNAAEYSGYSNYNPVSSTYFSPATFQSTTLDQTTGYSINFTVSLDPLTVVDKSMLGNPRAAFSIIATSYDSTATKLGIEIGFRPSSIFAQSSSFGTANSLETAAFDTSATTTYTLTVFNNTYSLASGGTPIIGGALKNYTFLPASSTPPLTFNPYAIDSFLFLGDDTGKASGTFILGTVTLDTTPVPFEFSPTYGLLAISTGMAINSWRKKISSSKKSWKSDTFGLI